MLPRARLLAASALASVLLAMGGCETVQFGPEPVVPSDTARTEATLLFANQRQTDQGALELLLYPSTAQDVEDAVPVKEYPAVDFGQSASLKVEPGRYKVAYRMESGDLRPMPADDDEGIETIWPVATFASGKGYSLLIETDEGNHTVWRTNIPVSGSP